MLGLRLFFVVNLISAVANFWAYLYPGVDGHPTFNLCVALLNVSAIAFTLYQLWRTGTK